MKFFEALIWMIIIIFALGIAYNLVWTPINTFVRPILFDCATGVASTGCLSVDNTTIAQITEGHDVGERMMNYVWFILGFSVILFVIIVAFRKERQEVQY